MSKKFDDMCIRLGTIPVLDGQTDGRREIVKQYRAVPATHADAR